jgi:hypothetical protein
VDDFAVTRFRDTPVSFYEWNAKFIAPHLEYTDRILKDVVGAMIAMRDRKMYEASDLMRAALANCGVTVGFNAEGNAVVQVDFMGWQLSEEEKKRGT